MDPFLGQISLFGCNFAPQGWALCQGQVLSIPQNTALFSLLGVNFGGDGRTNFQLPDLRGRAPIGFGQGPGLSAYSIGQTGGYETVSISSANYPAHSHTSLLPPVRQPEMRRVVSSRPKGNRWQGRNR